MAGNEALEGKLDHAAPANRQSGKLSRTRPEVVVVTGASAGMGRAVVRRFARDRAHIGLLARGVDGLEGARRDVEAAGGRAHESDND